MSKKSINAAKALMSSLEKLGVEYIFGYPGGAAMPIFDAIYDSSIKLILVRHEQGATHMADGYARATGKPGVVLVTSGPGATNLITGICCSYYDSVPLLLITGQVSTFRMTGNTGVRQIGFQETPITKITEEITKYSVTINDPDNIRYELEKAYYIARSGRPGPVLIDIPDNIEVICAAINTDS